MIEVEAVLYGGITYIGQYDISFIYDGNPDFLHTFSHMDSVISLLEDVIKEDFTVYEGVVTFDPHREDVDICIIVKGLRYYGHFRYYTYWDNGMIDGKLIYLAENDDDDCDARPYRLPSQNSLEEFYLQKIVEFDRKTYLPYLASKDQD